MPHIRVRRLQRHERTQARRLFLAMADGYALDFYRAIGGTMSAVTYFSFSPAAV